MSASISDLLLSLAGHLLISYLVQTCTARSSGLITPCFQDFIPVVFGRLERFIAKLHGISTGNLEDWLFRRVTFVCVHIIIALGEPECNLLGESTLGSLEQLVVARILVDIFQQPGRDMPDEILP